jgi:hypothetical protein
MIVNFRVHEITPDIYKLVLIFMFIIIIKNILKIYRVPMNLLTILYLQSNIIGDEVRWLITSLHHPIVMISNKYNKSAF